MLVNSTHIVFFYPFLPSIPIYHPTLIFPQSNFLARIRIAILAKMRASVGSYFSL